MFLIYLKKGLSQQCIHACFYRVGVLPTNLVGIQPTAFSIAVINTSLVTDPADAQTLAQVLQEQLLKVCNSAIRLLMVQRSCWLAVVVGMHVCDFQMVQPILFTHMLHCVDNMHASYP